MWQKLSAHLRRGQRGEQLAARHLRQHGLTILTNNYRTRYGEIDLITCDGDCLVFVEVRTRKTGAYVSAAESIGPAKQRKWQRSAQYYLQHHHPHQPPPCRFDAICIHIDACGRAHIDWLQDVLN